MYHVVFESGLQVIEVLFNEIPDEFLEFIKELGSYKLEDIKEIEDIYYDEFIKKYK